MVIAVISGACIAVKFVCFMCLGGGILPHILCIFFLLIKWPAALLRYSRYVLRNFSCRVRFHYGHPDVFDRLFHLTRGGISKASKVMNLSEDIFAGMFSSDYAMRKSCLVLPPCSQWVFDIEGFNSTLRQGNVTHHEYIQLGKGRDVGMNQISNFEAKVANGNGEQTLCRDIYRLGHRFDFFRMLSMYFTTVGFYFNSMVWVSYFNISTQ